MSNSNRAGMFTGESLLKMGRSLRILAITVIVVLSAGIAILVYGQLRQTSPLTDVIHDPTQWMGGFAVMMLLTVGYLVGKSWTTTRYQRQLIERLMHEEAIAQAQKLDPITQFHHPEVCRSILLRHAGYAGRLKSPLSLLQLTVSILGKLPMDSQTQPFTADLIRQLQSLCRPIDSLLRWTPDSFLLVLPEINEACLPAIHSRFQQDMEKWCEEHLEKAQRLVLQWRAVVSDNLNTSGDILFYTQRLLDNENLLAPAPQEKPQQPWQREKSVAIAMELQIHGTDGQGDRFQEAILTERVARDRIWFALNKNLAEQSSLTVTGRNGAFQELATVIRLLQRNGEQLVEAQFAKPPANWVVGGV